jgi:NADPH-dependent 7-cyano-7-deazaguanine reductase QueF
MTVHGEFASRGGISVSVEASHTSKRTKKK